MALRPLLSSADPGAYPRDRSAHRCRLSDGTLYLICILKGACYFMADLSRAITAIPLSTLWDLQLRKRQEQFRESGSRRIWTSARRRDVLIVEDIIDSGVTLNYLVGLLRQRRPKSIRIAALLDKPERRLRPVEVHTSDS